MKDSQQDELPFADDKKLDSKALLARERLETIHQEFGFLPHSKRETNLAIGVLENKDRPAGFGRYLNEVLHHQQTAQTEHPEKALKRIVSEIVGFARDTVASRTFIQEVDEELEGTHGFVTLEHIDNLSNWRYQSSTLHGLRELQRTVGTSDMLSGDSDAIDIDKLGTNEAIESMVATLRVYDARNYIQNFKEQEQKRFDFWIEQLEVSGHNHMAVSGMAHAALTSLGVKNPRVTT